MLSNRIKQFRTYYNIEPESIAKTLNIDLDEYLKYESSEVLPNINILTKLASIYKVTLNELYGHNPMLQLYNEQNYKDKTKEDEYEALKFAELSIDEKELILAYRTIDNKERIFKLITEEKI